MDVFGGDDTARITDDAIARTIKVADSVPSGYVSAYSDGKRWVCTRWWGEMCLHTLVGRGVSVYDGGERGVCIL